MVESIPALKWERKKGSLVHIAKLPDGELSIKPVDGGHELWFHEKGEWGKNIHLGLFQSRQAASDYADIWVGDQ